MKYMLLDYESIIASKSYTSKAQDNLESINRKKAETIKQIDKLEKYKSINSILNLLMARWSYSRDPEDVKAIKRILNNSIIKNEKRAIGFDAKYELYFIKAKVYRFLLEDTNGLQYRLKLVELMEEYPETIEINPEKYVAKLHDFINYCLSTETGIARAYPVQKYLAKLKKYMEIVNSRNMNAQIKSLCWYYYYQMQIGYSYTCLDKDGFYSTMIEVNNQIDFHKNHLRVRYLLNFYYYCTITYFEFENYEESLNWHTRFLNHKEAPIYEEIYHTALIFSIILHYELKNYELAEFLINNTKRYYRKEEKLYESEKVILGYLKKLLYTDNYNEIFLLFKQLYKELNKLALLDSEKRFLNAFNFERWISKNIKRLQ
jgi:hypothetical protein